MAHLARESSEYPGALYHVMNRGNQRATVFHEPADYELFLEKLEQTAEQFIMRVHCFCLMPNHFHLYVKTEQANLSRFMQSLLTGFTISWNQARGSGGHVFQRRFKSHLVEGAVLAVMYNTLVAALALRWRPAMAGRHTDLHR